MQTELIKLLAAFFFAHYFVNVVMIPVKRKLKIAGRVKPFDCTVCLSVWVALALWFAPLYASEFILVLFGAGFLANKIQ
jgi:hypothetical protein